MTCSNQNMGMTGSHHFINHHKVNSTNKVFISQSHQPAMCTCTIQYVQGDITLCYEKKLSQTPVFFFFCWITHYVNTVVKFKWMMVLHFFVMLNARCKIVGTVQNVFPKVPFFPVRSTILLLAWLGLAATDILDVSFNKYVIKQTVIHVILTWLPWGLWWR